MDNHNFASTDTAFTQFKRVSPSSNKGTKRSRITPRASPSSRARKTRRYVHLPSSPRGLIFTTGIVPTKTGKFPGISHGTRPSTKRSSQDTQTFDLEDTQPFDSDGTQPTSQNTGGLRYKYKYKRLYRS
jgi:hypothetical protein